MSETVTNGACYCGAVKVTAVGDPKAVLVCHCRDCARWFGSLNMATLFERDKVTVTGETVEVPAKAVPFFKSGKELRELAVPSKEPRSCLNVSECESIHALAKPSGYGVESQGCSRPLRTDQLLDARRVCVHE